MAKYKEIRFTGEHEKIGRLLTDKKITKEELLSFGEPDEVLCIDR